MSIEPIYSSAVREMPEEDRPRERLARLGAEALRDAELIAIILRSGTRKMGAVALADEIIRRFVDIRAVSRASLEELKQINGMGTVKAIELKAALELGLRLAAHTGPKRTKIRSAEDVVELLMARFKQCETEHLKSVLLTTKHEVMRVIDVSHGGLDGTAALPRDIFRQAVREGATAVIVTHNHPSGDPEPSRDDISLTQRLVEAADLIGLSFLDHIIFGDGRYVSLKERV